MAKKKHVASKQLFDSQETVPSMPDGYYSGDQPNPQLGHFVETHSTPYDPDTDDYSVRGFSKPITTTKATAIYNMHTYWSKKPHDAIRQYIRHYTSPGDIVLDPFCGSGGTCLAALLDGRTAIAIDRSPAATFITKNYCTPVPHCEIAKAIVAVRQATQKDFDWLYGTKCDRCGGKAVIGYTVYSQVFQCGRCMARIPLYDCDEVVEPGNDGKDKKFNACPHCYKQGHKERIRSQSEKFGSVPVATSYICHSGCKPKRAFRSHNDVNENAKNCFHNSDLAKIKEIEESAIPYWFPKGYTMKGFSRYQRDALFYYEVEEVADLYTKRNLWAIAAVRHAISKVANEHVRDFLHFGLNAALLGVSRMVRASNTATMPGTYYMPQVSKEVHVWESFENKTEVALKGHLEIDFSTAPQVIISTQSSCQLTSLPANSIDYIFTDPPYSHTVQYGELNFVWEAWQKADTTWHGEEIIVNDSRGKSESDWSAQMFRAMSECFRVLKPGRWLSLCYHDTSEGTWELVQDIMAEVGFIVDKTDTALFIDTGQKSYNQLTADKSTKRDLVLNFRKPKPLLFKVTKVYGPENAVKLSQDGDIATFSETARQIVRDYLIRHPGATKDRIYDELVNRLVVSRSMEAHDFDALLKSVAEEVQQPVKEDLFRNKEPDLWGSHIQSRWYLKETADQVDQAEQVKEDAAATRLGNFIGEYLKKSPELEGVHYSDLFEQYLPVHDKPRRLLADWLPEYFIKTPGGTWRLPDKDEAAELAQLREQGTLRRIKRFANALIDGVPVRDKDRPGNDVDLLDWLRQCRRAGLYEQGRAIYEKGGLNLANLSDEQQIEAEDDYRICVRRGSKVETKPKRKSRKKQDDDE
jgi:DNA modification methylase